MNMMKQTVLKPGQAVKPTCISRPACLGLGLPVRRAPLAAPPAAAATTNTEPLSQNEIGRREHRSVYDYALWRKHRSPYRLIDRLLQIPRSRIVQNIVPSLVWVASVSTALVAYNYAFANAMLPEGLPSLAVNDACKTFMSYTSVALSLLLVFRTNASYGRWDEARKMWGLLVNRSRDTMRQGVSLFPQDAPEGKAALARWLIAFVRSFRVFCQPETTIDAELKSILTPKELEMLKNSGNPPVKAIHALSEVIHGQRMDGTRELQMTTNLSNFHDILGGCERLLRAPIPVSYTRHTARFLFLWLTALPFSITNISMWDVPIIVLIAGVLCAIEEIGVQCEEPFGILPLEVICNRIQTDVMNTLKDDLETRNVLREAKVYYDKEEAPARVPVNTYN